jgi:hypothetical protein
VTGRGKRPLGDAMIVAFSMSAGAMKSGTTDTRGFYRIDGLAPGRYIVFKSKMENGSSNIGFDLMRNMRLKSVSVRRDQITRRMAACACSAPCATPASRSPARWSLR